MKKQMGLFCTFSLTRLYNRLPFFLFVLKYVSKITHLRLSSALPKSLCRICPPLRGSICWGQLSGGFAYRLHPPAMFPPRLRRSIFHGRFGSFHNHIGTFSVSCRACPAITHFEKFGLSSVSLELWGSVSKCARVIPQKRWGSERLLVDDLAILIHRPPMGDVAGL